MHEEYISREAALKAANEWVSEACMAPVMRVSRLLDKLQKVPAADVAQVVQCRYCKYGDYDSRPNGAMVCLRTNDGFWRKETDFCSYGEYQTNTGGVTK